MSPHAEGSCWTAADPRGARSRAPGDLPAGVRRVRLARGSVFLVAPRTDGDSVGRFLAARGGDAVLGVTIAVRSLRAAQALLEATLGRPLRPYPGALGPSIAVPPELTRGVWLEFTEG